MSDNDPADFRSFARQYATAEAEPPAQSFRAFVGAPPPAPDQFSAEGAADVGKALASGVGRGVVSTPGIVGDVASLAPYAGPALRYGVGKVREFLDRGAARQADEGWEADTKRIEAAKTPEERRGTHARVLGLDLPTSSGMTKFATKLGVPGLEYKATTPVGRGAATVGEFAGGAFGFGLPGAAMKGSLKGALREAVSPVTLGAGVAAGAAHEALPDSSVAPIAAALAGGLGAGAARQRLMPGRQRDMAERLAADVARKHLPDVGDAQQRLASALPPAAAPRGRVEPSLTGVLPSPAGPQGRFAPGATPTTAQLVPELSGLTPPELRRPGLGEQNFADQVAALQARIQPPAPSMADALGIPLVDNPMGVSAQQARQVFDTVHDAYKGAADAAWAHPAIAQARYKTREVGAAVDEAIKKMGPATFENMPVELRRYVEQLKTYGGEGIPLTELQKVKTFANSMVRNPMVMDKSGAVALTTLLDDVMTDTANVLPRYMSGTVYPEAAGAWDAARKATYDYKKLFAVDARTKANVDLEKLTGVYPKGTTQAGMPIIPGEETLKFLDSPRALQTYREMTALPGMDVNALNRSVGDWIVGKLTKNGETPMIGQKEIANYLKNPRNAEIVNSVPGLRDRLDLIAGQSRAEKLQAALGNVLEDGSPKKFRALMEKHGDDLREVFSGPEQRAFLDQMDQSSRVLSRLPSGPISEERLYRLLQDGNLFTILHGHASGALAAAVAGLIAGKAVGVAAPALAGYEMLGAGAGTLGFFKKPTELLARASYGPVKEASIEALHRAMADPEYMRILLQKPSIENILNPASIPGLKQILGKGAPEATELGYLAGRQTQPQEQPQGGLTIPMYNTPTGGPRPQRKAGGRIGQLDHGGIAMSLIRAAEKAKKGHNTTTEPLLEQPDEAITKALAIADKALQ